MDRYDRIWTAKKRADLALQVVQRVAMFGEENQLLMGRRHGLWNVASSTRQGRLTRFGEQTLWRKDLAEKLSKLRPLGIEAALPDLTSHAFQS
jgi:hypothetical protein